jgi:hypothetical protein
VNIGVMKIRIAWKILILSEYTKGAYFGATVLGNAVKGTTFPGVLPNF